MYCTVPHCTVLYCTVLYCTVLYCTVPHCTVLYCTILYCTALHNTVLYYTVLLPFCYFYLHVTYRLLFSLFITSLLMIITGRHVFMGYMYMPDKSAETIDEDGMYPPYSFRFLSLFPYPNSIQFPYLFALFFFSILCYPSLCFCPLYFISAFLFITSWIFHCKCVNKSNVTVHSSSSSMLYYTVLNWQASFTVVTWQSWTLTTIHSLRHLPASWRYPH